jgi:hypothetical protein
MGYKPIKGYDFRSVPKMIDMVRLTNEDRKRFYRSEYHRPYQDQPFGILVNGQLLCYHQQFMDQSRLTPSLYCASEEHAIGVVRQFLRLDQEFPYEVCKFKYDGFGGTSDKNVIMPYRAAFDCWTGDPGVAMMKCSDGERRFIPTFAIKYSFATLPNDLTRVHGDGAPVFFGSASKS